jgi:putative sterol carrier protein
MSDAEALMGQMRAKGPGLRSLGYRIRFDLTDTGESILLDGTGGQALVHAAAGDEEVDTVLSLTAENLGKLIAGRLSPMLAFTMGKLKVEGSKGVALKLASLLDEG